MALHERNVGGQQCPPLPFDPIPAPSVVSITRVALYARVSKDDQVQDPENQLEPLRKWCADHGHVIVAEYIDRSSGKNTIGRPRFQKLFEELTGIDLVLTWSLDRWSREGMVATVTHLQKLADGGVAFRSLQEPSLSTDDELVRNVLLACWSSLAKAERLRISERTKAGLARVRRNGSRSGKPIGRPSVTPEQVELIHRLVAEGITDKHVISDRVGCSWRTVYRYLDK